MSNESEKFGLPPPEQNQEQTPNQEQSAAEQEISEAELQKNLEQATGEIESSQNEVIASVDRRIKGVPVSSGLSEEKATEIYEQGGFAEKVNATKEQITELGKETKIEVEGLTLRSVEVRDFTKKYSSFWRDQMAEKIRNARKIFHEKKTSVQDKNLERSVNRTELQSEITTLENNVNEIQTNLEVQKIKLEKEKNRVAYRIANLFGRTKEIPNEGTIKELESEAEKLRKNLEEKRKLFGECEEILLDDNELKEAKKEAHKFYEEQKDIHDVFEKEKDKGRDVTSISKEKRVLFLHALPLDGYGMGNTSENNPNIDTEKMTSVDKTRIVLGIEPTISVSTINISGENSGNKFQTMYPMGLIIGEGTVLSAYGGDAGTYSDNPFVRRSKYDRRLKSAVQENFTENMERAMKGEAGEGTMQMGWNEVVVENPKVSGIFLDMNRFVGDKTKAVDAIKQAFKMGKEFGIPVYDIRPNGEMSQLLSEDFRPVTQENILSYQCELGAEEKIEGVEKVLKTQEKPNAQIQRRLTDIRTKEKSDETFLKTQEKRVSYSSKAEENFNALEYENIARYMLKTLDRIGNVGFEEITKTAVGEGVNQRGLEKINLLFGSKTTDEIRFISESMVQRATMLKELIESREKK